MKIFPQTANCMVQFAGTEYIVILYNQLQENIKKKDFKLLEILHHLTSGMKSVFT